MSQVKFSLLAEHPYSTGANLKIKGRWGRFTTQGPGLVSTSLGTSESKLCTVEDPRPRTESKSLKNTQSPTFRFLSYPRLEKVETDGSPQKMWYAPYEVPAEGIPALDGLAVRKPQCTECPEGGSQSVRHLGFPAQEPGSPKGKILKGHSNNL